MIKQARTIDYQQEVFMDETKRINDYDVQRRKILNQKEEAIRKRKLEIIEEQLLKDLSKQHKSARYKHHQTTNNDPFKT